MNTQIVAQSHNGTPIGSKREQNTDVFYNTNDLKNVPTEKSPMQKTTYCIIPLK